MHTNRRSGPVNTNWGDMVGICKLRPWAELENTNLGVNTRWGPGPVNTNWGPGLVSANWGPGPGAKQRAGGRETQTPPKF